MMESTEVEQVRNREAWLTDAISGFVIPLIRQRTGFTPLKPIRVSVGFPPSGGRTRANTGQPGSVGVCMTSVRHKNSHIFIHPAFDDKSLLDAKGVMEILIHETLHACLPEKVGHRKEFSQAAKKVGLEGKPTATLLGDDLREVCAEWIKALGPYPHDEGIWAGGKLQRVDPNLKCTCPMCGYIARTTRKWLDAAGAPVCPQDMIQMVEGSLDDEIDSPLGPPFHQTIEYPVKLTRKLKDEAKKIGYQLKWDERWTVRMNRYYGTVQSVDGKFRKGMVTDWHIIDHGELYTTAMINGKLERIVNLNPSPPRKYLCESREDALANIEALREGMSPEQLFDYEEIDLAQGAAPKTDDPNDPALDDMEDPEDDEYEDEEETADDTPYTDDELVVYEQERIDREQGRPKVTPTSEPSYEQRVKELERLRKTTKKGKAA